MLATSAAPRIGPPLIAIDIPRQLLETLPMRRSLVIIVSAIVLLTIVIAVWWGLSHKVSFTFVRYVQSPADKTWTAELRLENNVGWPIQYQNTTTYKRHVPGCVYREKLTSGWSAAQQDPWPNAEASAQYFALFPGKNAIITIPLAPGTPPRIVGIQYNLCDGPKSAFTRRIETLVSRVKRLLNIHNDSGPEVWCPEALTAPSTPLAHAESETILLCCYFPLPPSPCPGNNLIQ
ncbi:MAG: hypothetical protein JWR69_1576 [Pedosphaera sp.]|nr:hypothetical protein [Pedosphaera sp.]